MPTYRGITTELVSQYGAVLIQEYAPVAQAQSTALTSASASQAQGDYGHGGEGADPDQDVVFIDEQKFVISVFTHVYSGSQFWLAYAVADRVPPGRLYYFKLFVDGKHIVSWGTTEKQEYKGKVMFRLEPARKSRGGNYGVMVRSILRFAGERTSCEEATEVKSCLELRVYRSYGRAPAPYVEAFTNDATDGIGEESAIKLAYGGKTSASHPKNYFNYALEDPLELPYATIRYYPRRPDKIDRLQLRILVPYFKPSSPVLDIASPVAVLQHSRSALQEERSKVLEEAIGIAATATASTSESALAAQDSVPADGLADSPTSTTKPSPPPAQSSSSPLSSLQQQPLAREEDESPKLKKRTSSLNWFGAARGLSTPPPRPRSDSPILPVSPSTIHEDASSPVTIIDQTITQGAQSSVSLTTPTRYKPESPGGGYVSPTPLATPSRSTAVDLRSPISACASAVPAVAMVQTPTGPVFQHGEISLSPTATPTHFRPHLSAHPVPLTAPVTSPSSRHSLSSLFNSPSSYLFPPSPRTTSHTENSPILFSSPGPHMSPPSAAAAAAPRMLSETAASSPGPASAGASAGVGAGVGAGVNAGAGAGRAVTTSFMPISTPDNNKNNSNNNNNNNNSRGLRHKLSRLTMRSSHSRSAHNVTSASASSGGGGSGGGGGGGGAESGRGSSGRGSSGRDSSAGASGSTPSPTPRWSTATASAKKTLKKALGWAVGKHRSRRHHGRTPQARYGIAERPEDWQFDWGWDNVGANDRHSEEVRYLEESDYDHDEDSEGDADERRPRVEPTGMI